MATDPQRDAWLRKYAAQPAPWSGPVHAAPLLAGLVGRVVELGAAGGKVAPLLPAALALDWVPVRGGRPSVVGDVRRLPLRSASVDAMVAIHVLDHLSDDAALVEWARVLRPGGALVLEVFARGDARDDAGAQGASEREGILTRYRERDELTRALCQAGFAGALALEERAMRWGVRRVLRGRVERARA